MSILIGFDFGTHQTKICVQDATNPSEKTYQFLEFDMPDGNSTLLFPSIVQFNRDHTISYGFVDENNALSLDCPQMQEPQLLLLPEPPAPILPKYKVPSNYPPKPKRDPWIDSLKKLKGQKSDIELWEEQCAEIDKKAKRKWEVECAAILSSYKSKCAEIKSKNANIKRQYDEDLKEWELLSKDNKQIFRYFKMNAFTGSGRWDSRAFKSSDICVLYISYLILIIKARFGDDFAIQFGVPCGATGTQRDKAITKRAYEIYIAAADLADKFATIHDYISSTYETLLHLIEYKKIDDALINQYYFDDIPEAFAGLVAITLQKKLGTGLHLLVDIGGGTTDIALFCVTKEGKRHGTHHSDSLPDVIYATSIPQGINFILEESVKTNDSIVEDLQKLFLMNPSSELFRSPIISYKTILRKKGKEISKLIEKAFVRSFHHHGLKSAELYDALESQPVIYGGGGGTFKELHTPLTYFTDVRQINQNILAIRNLQTQGIEDKVFTILATSYGLASYVKPYDSGIKCTDISVFFKEILPKKAKKYRSYDKYEHGLTDL